MEAPSLKVILQDKPVVSLKGCSGSSLGVCRNCLAGSGVSALSLLFSEGSPEEGGGMAVGQTKYKENSPKED
ncbi:Protein Transport Protein Sec23B [Manis pentadactyla]|nr:Protein Transport Protein Sec23B [Manis pentadactyla]